MLSSRASAPTETGRSARFRQRKTIGRASGVSTGASCELIRLTTAGNEFNTIFRMAPTTSSYGGLARCGRSSRVAMKIPGGSSCAAAKGKITRAKGIARRKAPIAALHCSHVGPTGGVSDSTVLAFLARAAVRISSSLLHGTTLNESPSATLSCGTTDEGKPYAISVLIAAARIGSGHCARRHGRSHWFDNAPRVPHQEFGRRMSEGTATRSAARSAALERTATTLRV